MVSWYGVSTMMGKCTKCQEIKKFQHYRKVNGGKYYYRDYCVQCWSASRREYQKAYAKRNAEHLTKYHAEKYLRTRETGRIVRKRYYDKWKKVVFDHYGNSCVCCGETEPRFLTIDHMNNDGAQHRKDVGMGSVLFRWLVNNSFPKDFRILCFNCNSGRFHNGGMCPHETKAYQPSNWIV